MCTCRPFYRLRSTHVVVAAFVVLVFGLYVDGKLGQEGALGRREEETRQAQSLLIPVWRRRCPSADNGEPG